MDDECAVCQVLIFHSKLLSGQKQDDGCLQGVIFPSSGPSFLSEINTVIVILEVVQEMREICNQW